MADKRTDTVDLGGDNNASMFADAAAELAGVGIQGQLTGAMQTALSPEDLKLEARTEAARLINFADSIANEDPELAQELRDAAANIMRNIADPAATLKAMTEARATAGAAGAYIGGVGAATGSASAKYGYPTAAQLYNGPFVSRGYVTDIDGFAEHWGYDASLLRSVNNHFSGDAHYDNNAYVLNSMGQMVRDDPSRRPVVEDIASVGDAQDVILADLSDAYNEGRISRAQFLERVAQWQEEFSVRGAEETGEAYNARVQIAQEFVMAAQNDRLPPELIAGLSAAIDSGNLDAIKAANDQVTTYFERQDALYRSSLTDLVDPAVLGQFGSIADTYLRDMEDPSIMSQIEALNSPELIGQLSPEDRAVVETMAAHKSTVDSIGRYTEVMGALQQYTSEELRASNFYGRSVDERMHLLEQAALLADPERPLTEDDINRIRPLVEMINTEERADMLMDGVRMAGATGSLDPVLEAFDGISLQALREKAEQGDEAAASLLTSIETNSQITYDDAIIRQARQESAVGMLASITRGTAYSALDYFDSQVSYINGIISPIAQPDSLTPPSPDMGGDISEADLLAQRAADAERIAEMERQQRQQDYRTLGLYMRDPQRFINANPDSPDGEFMAAVRENMLVAEDARLREEGVYGTEALDESERRVEEQIRRDAGQLPLVPETEEERRIRLAYEQYATSRTEAAVAAAAATPEEAGTAASASAATPSPDAPAAPAAGPAGMPPGVAEAAAAAAAPAAGAGTSNTTPASTEIVAAAAPPPYVPPPLAAGGVGPS